MRCIAWLDAALDPPKKPPASTRHDLAPSITRRQKLHAEGVEFALPELEGERYLLDVLFDVGPCLPSGMGALPLGYGQLQAWQQHMGVDLTPWEARTLQRLSRAYCRELVASADPAAAAPGSAREMPEQESERRTRVAGVLAQSLRMLRDTRPQR